MLNNKTINIGNENAAGLIETLTQALAKLGGVSTSSTELNVAGQDVLICEYLVDRYKIQIVIETYAGIEISGNRTIVDKIHRMLSDISNRTNS